MYVSQRSLNLEPGRKHGENPLSIPIRYNAPSCTPCAPRALRATLPRPPDQMHTESGTMQNNLRTEHTPTSQNLIQTDANCHATQHIWTGHMVSTGLHAPYDPSKTVVVWTSTRPRYTGPCTPDPPVPQMAGGCPYTTPRTHVAPVAPASATDPWQKITKNNHLRQCGSCRVSL